MAMEDLTQRRARVGDINVPSKGGVPERVDITWRPEKKRQVIDYADANGWSFNYFVNRVLREHVAKEAKKRRWKKLDDVKSILKKLSANETLAGYIRGVVLGYIDSNPLRLLPKPPKQDDLEGLKETRPDALVYVIPVNGTRIVASGDGDGGWRGLLFDPSIIGSVSTWHSTHLNPPVWAKTPTVLKSLAFIGSRIDMDGFAWFSIPHSSIRVSARWDEKTRRFESGDVVETKVDKRRQAWVRGGWYATMPDPMGPFNLRPNVRRVLNMLCRTLTVGNDGLTAHVPSH